MQKSRHFTVALCPSNLFLTKRLTLIKCVDMQERANVARKIIDVVRKKRAKMVKDIEMLCNAYITLAYMDASRHKTEKSEYK